MKDPIDSRQLHIFLALARRGSLRAAAAELFLTSSAISHSIHNLEASLETKLFSRPGKTLELTERGQFLVREADNILNSMNRLREQLVGENSLNHEPFRIAVGYNFLVHLLPGIIREWQSSFPKAKLIARGAERDTCLKLLDENQIDASILVDPPQVPSLERHVLFEDELRVVAAANSPFAKAESVYLRSLHGKTLLVSRIQSHTTKLILGEMRRNGFSFHECIEVGSPEAVYEMIRLGDAVTLQPDWVLDHRISENGLVIRPLNQVKIVRNWAYVARADKPMGMMQRTFLRLCQRVSEKTIPFRATASILFMLGSAWSDEMASLLGVS